MDIPTRKSGLERPFHPFQVTSWIFQTFNILAYFCTTIPCLSFQSRIPTTIIFTALEGLVIYLGYKISKSDPTDDIIEQFRLADKVLANQLEEKHDKFCNFCRSPVDSSSKHCVRCNRCTVKFDHHCKWVNNCIGGKNYRLFIYLIITCLSLQGFLFILCMNIIISAASDPLAVDRNIMEFYHLHILVFFIVIQSILAIEGLIFSALLGYLVGLHIFLTVKGMTTYEYILIKRSKQQVIPKGSMSDREIINAGKCHAHNISGSDNGIGSSRI